MVVKYVLAKQIYVWKYVRFFGFEIYKQYRYLPITTDSHLGEYIQWAYSVADHDAIIEFSKIIK